MGIVFTALINRRDGIALGYSSFAYKRAKAYFYNRASRVSTVQILDRIHRLFVSPFAIQLSAWTKRASMFAGSRLSAFSLT